MLWDDERVDRLKEYWARGLSSGQIARALRGPTRNAVIGKVHRLGLSRRAPARKGGRTMSKTQHTAVRKMLTGEAPKPPAPPPPVKREPNPDYRPVGRVSFADLEGHHCRWPVGDGEALKFCGQPKVLGQSYCADCGSIAYVPPKPRAEVKPFFVQRTLLDGA